MTDAALPADRYTAGEFRVGRVISRALSVLSHNIFKFSIVTGIAASPMLFIPQRTGIPIGVNPFNNMSLIGTVVVLYVVLTLLSQAIIFYGAFQDMRGRPVNLGEGFKVALGRFFPLIGLGLVIVLVLSGISLVIGLVFAVPVVQSASPFIIFLAVILFFFVPVMMLFVMWSMASPVCVVEQAGPFRGLGRSRELTKGNRWKLFGLLLLAMIVWLIISVLVTAATSMVAVLFPAGALVVIKTVNLVWSAVWSAFGVILLVVSYHDLRVAKDGIDTDQIAAVFE